jgi:hypothetical protein
MPMSGNGDKTVPSKCRKEGAMTTFDLAEVRRFATDLSTRMDRCDNGEGMECANLDASLRHYADLCCKFVVQVRQWGRGVFAGRVAFDPAVEAEWLEQGVAFYNRAYELFVDGERAEVPCYILDSQALLSAAMGDLFKMLTTWVTPKRSVSPSARLGLVVKEESVEEAKRRIAQLKPLPADWQPDNARQRMRFRKIRRR